LLTAATTFFRHVFRIGENRLDQNPRREAGGDRPIDFGTLVDFEIPMADPDSIMIPHSGE